jgi:hypothetical protein
MARRLEICAICEKVFGARFHEKVEIGLFHLGIGGRVS